MGDEGAGGLIAFGFRGDEESFKRCTRKVLTKKHLEKMFELENELDHVEDEFGQSIWPEDMQLQCQPKPWRYMIIEKELTEVKDAASDPRYQGATSLDINNVPIDCTRIDLECWIRAGLDTEDRAYMSTWAQVVAVEDEVKEMEKKIKKVPEKEFINVKTGKPEASKEEAVLRKAYFEKCIKQKEELEISRNKLLAKVKRVKKIKRSAEDVQLEQVSTNELKATATWNCSLASLTHAPLEQQCVDKRNWMEIQLTRMDREMGYGPWACAQERFGRMGKAVPDKTREFELNMRGVRFERVRHGQGSYIDEGLDIYDGEWVRNVKHGKGARFSSGMEYRGTWQEGQQLGPAEVTYANGDFVKSEYNVNYLHEPSLLNPNQYAEGIPQGDTSYTFIDGSTYAGHFRDGRPNGYGLMCSSNGDVYAGQFQDGRFHGQGKFATESGQVMEGTWRESEMNGLGYMRSRFGQEFVGLLQDGDKNGRGVQKEKNGDRYIGYFRDDAKQGHGVFCYGNVSEDWDHATERIILSFERIYEGDWRAGRYRPSGIHTDILSGRVWFTTMHKSEERYPLMHHLQADYEKHTRRYFFSKHRKYERERDVRVVLERRNLKLFRQTRRLAREMLVEEAERLSSELEDLEAEIEHLQKLKDKRDRIRTAHISLSNSSQGRHEDDLLGLELEELLSIKANFPGLQTGLIFNKAQAKCDASSKRSKLRKQLNNKANAQSSKLSAILDDAGAKNIVAL
jgi:hypothetical protein